MYDPIVYIYIFTCILYIIQVVLVTLKKPVISQQSTIDPNPNKRPLRLRAFVYFYKKEEEEEEEE